MLCMETEVDTVNLMNRKHVREKCRTTEGGVCIEGVPGGIARLRESVPYVKLYRYNPKHLYPKLNGYGDNGQRSLKL